MWNNVENLFREYMGTGLIVIIFCISLIYLWIKENRKYVRIMFIYVPVILLFLFFNPLFAVLLYDLAENEIYYRILWLLPITVTVAFAAVTLYGKLPKKRRTIYVLAAAAGIVVSGSYIYKNPFFEKAENLYHVPDCVVHICDAIAVPGREVQAVFPLDLVQYVRQYDPTICMPYGREMTVERWYYWGDLPDEMEKEAVELSRLAPLAKEAGCHYIILHETKPGQEGFEKTGYRYVETAAGYRIYLQDGVYLGLDYEQGE